MMVNARNKTIDGVHEHDEDDDDDDDDIVADDDDAREFLEPSCTLPLSRDL